MSWTIQCRQLARIAYRQRARPPASGIFNGNNSFRVVSSSVLSNEQILALPPTTCGQCRMKHAKKKGGKAGKGSKGGGDSDDTMLDLDELAGIPETKARFQKSLDGLKHELSTLRGGKADPAMLDHIQVDSYGSMTNLSSVAQASMKGPQLICLSVYDPGMTKAVEEAIRYSDMSLNPISDGQGKVDVPIPKPDKETREAVAKVAGKTAEKTKVHLRGIRHKIVEQIKKHKDAFPEDDVHRKFKEIDKATQEAEAAAMKLLETRKAEILKV